MVKSLNDLIEEKHEEIFRALMRGNSDLERQVLWEELATLERLERESGSKEGNS